MLNMSKWIILFIVLTLIVMFIILWRLELIGISWPGAVTRVAGAVNSKVPINMS